MSSNQDVRVLARIEKIQSITPAVNADRLEIAHVKGWQVVVPKDTYREGQKVLFCEIDSLIPVGDPRFGIKPQSGAKDEKLRIKATRIRGNISQGIIFPLENFPGIEKAPEGVNLAKSLGITKYEPINTGNADIIGDFDTSIALKSDAERVQNLTEHYTTLLSHQWIATEKVDGTSQTVAHTTHGLRIFGRNKEQNPKNHPLFATISQQEFLDNIPAGWAVQGEFFGEKIQTNHLEITGRRFAIFAVFNNGIPVTREHWNEWMLEHSVPVLDFTLPQSVEELLNSTEYIESIISPGHTMEGIVFHHANGEVLPFLDRSNFKVVCSHFLEHHD